MIGMDSALMRTCFLFALLVGCAGVLATEPEWLGAEAALSRLSGSSAEADNPDADEADDSMPKLASDIDAFAEASGTLEPAEAAAQWLALLDRLLVLTAPNEDDDYGYGYGGGYGYGMEDTKGVPSFRRMIQVLPPPSAWDAIRDGIDSRPKPEKPGALLARYHTLRFFASFLVNDGEGVRGELEAIMQIDLSGEVRGRYQYAQLLRSLTQVLGENGMNREGEVEAFEKTLAEYEAGEQAWRLEVPDLVTLVGEPRATELLNRAFALPVQHMDFDDAGETKALARRLVVEQVDHLKRPIWGLVDTVDAVECYEAMAVKFLPNGGRPAGATVEPEAETQAQADTEADEAPSPAPAPAADGGAKKASSGGLSSIASGLLDALTVDVEQMEEDSPYDDYAYHSARQYYILGLIAAGRAEDAKLEIQTPRGAESWEMDIPYQGLDALNQAGYTAGVYQFLHLVLTEDPALPVWGAYAELAAHLNKTDEMLALAKASVDRDDLPDDVRKQVRVQLIDALLAADRVDEALAMIRQEITEDSDVPVLVSKLLEIGIALNDRDLLDEALPQGRAVVMKQGEDRSRMISSLVEAWFETNRLDEAEGFLVAYIKRHYGNMPTSGMPGVRRYGIDEKTNYMFMLLNVYGQAGRHEDVRYLLDHWDGWGVADVIQLENNYYYGLSEFGSASTLVHIARALHATGQTPEAEAAILYTLNEEPGSDKAYQALLEIKGPDAIDTLDVLFARDHYEERPLIWKAKLLTDQGKLDEAEAIIKQAISIDPSDGEQGRGDRMRAYRVLGSIAKARGDQEQVDFLARVDDAIRLSEDADRVYSAGMYKRGIEMYRASLESFADAYCIQSRLAIQLSAQGRHEEAEKHYKRAYELMPDSFGRVESHCFGCEGVFSDEKAQGVAERVFSALIEERPDSPQVHYLMGYLREQQAEDAQAAEHYQRAVALDPAYLNAWERLASVARRANLPIEVRDRASINLVRLDPLGRHTFGTWRGVIDLRALWPILEANLKQRPEVPDSIYRLNASADKVKEMEDLMADPYGSSRSYLSQRDRYRNAKTPGAVLVDHRVIDAVADVFDQ